VIGVQSGPRGRRVHSGFRKGHGSRGWDAGGGDDCEDSSGIFLQENLDLDELVADRAWEVLYVFAPVPIKGATGSSGSPIAIR
jgi:hypothetical protein